MHQQNDATRSETVCEGRLTQRSRAQRWRNAVGELTALQKEYEAWWESLPSHLQEGATAEALQAICELDLGELEAIEPPRGFGRD